MSDDVNIKITGSNLDLKRELKKAEKILNRFDKVNKRSSQRRTKQAKKTSQNIQRITAAEVRHTMGIRRRMTRMLERDRKQREREAIRAEKRQARERERILRRHAARRRRIMRGISRFGMRTLGLLGLGGGIGVIYKAREILKYDETLARLSVQANVSKEKQFELRDAINKTSLEFGVQRDVIADVVRRIVDKSGEFDVAANNLDKLAMILRGTGVDAEDLGETVAALAAQFKGSGENIFDFLEILIAQGDKGVINLKDLASEAEGLIGAFSRAGLKGKKAFTEFGALVQISGLGGTAAEAATFVAQFLNQVRRRGKMLEEQYGKRFPGFKLLGKKGELIGITNTIEQLLRVSGGNLTILQKMIPRMRGAAPIELIAQEGKLEEYFRSFVLGEKAADNIRKKFERVADTASQGFERMFAGITLFADKALTDPLNDMADAFQRILDDPAAMQQLESTARTIGSTIQALLHLGKTGGDIIGFIPKLFGIDLDRAARAGIRRKKIPKELKHLVGDPYGQIGQIIPGHMERLEESLDRVEFMVQNNITVDETGKISESDAVLIAQVNSDRGLTSVQKSVRQARMR